MKQDQTSRRSRSERGRTLRRHYHHVSSMPRLSGHAGQRKLQIYPSGLRCGAKRVRRAQLRLGRFPTRFLGIGSCVMGSGRRKQPFRRAPWRVPPITTCRPRVGYG